MTDPLTPRATRSIHSSPRPARSPRILRLAAAMIPLAAMMLLASSCNLVKPKEKKKFGEACESPFDCESTNCNRERATVSLKLQGGLECART